MIALLPSIMIKEVNSSLMELEDEKPFLTISKNKSWGILKLTQVLQVLWNFKLPATLSTSKQTTWVRTYKNTMLNQI